MILGGLTAFLIIIIGLVVTIMKLPAAANEEKNPQQPENLSSDYLMRLYSPTIRNRRPASEGEVETHVIYSEWN
ncbi:uncharacterized protein AKAME5_002930300 [Lates japonicus]|uniref:Uncharacterized protein n=1 Tax=Lates japonicus TaxID=270547 RepID=A0AAD3N547_LATJO|nr:uncharacterized protein AKAME5_002930300 [Lates japonicus]